MNKDQLIGILLIGVILIGYMYFTKPSAEELRNNEIKDSIAYVERENARQQQMLEEMDRQAITSNTGISDAAVDDSLRLKDLQRNLGSFANAGQGVKEFFTIENDKIELKISTLGGRVYSARLKEYQTHDSLPLILFDGDSTVFGFKFPTTDRKYLSTDKMFFTSQANRKTIDASSSANSLSMRMNVSDDQYLEYVYTLEPGSYMVDFDVNFINMDELIARNATSLDLDWKCYIPGQEKGRDFEKQYSSVYYKYYQDEVDNLSERSESDDEETTTKLKWVAYKQQFFSTVLIAEDYLGNSSFSSEEVTNDEKYLKYYDSEISVPYSGKRNEQLNFRFYFGPNHYQTLKQYDLEMQNLINLGWGIGWISKLIIIPVFNWLGSFISNYGIVILILTIMIKLVLFPLTYRSYKSTAKMRVLKPQIEELTKDIPKDKAMEKQQKTMAFYKKAGVSPMGGCLPMALQMPILLAMFRFFPASIELRQKAFLWASDLSSYDSVFSWTTEIPILSSIYGNHISLFTLLMTISTIFYTRLNQSQMGDANSAMPGMKTMMYIFPVMMLFWFNNYASGLSYYYLVANLITFGQMFLIKRFTDEDAILKQLEANKKKPVKKSGFQQRMEEMAKQRGYQQPKKKK